MIILSLETSCDETSIAIIKKLDGFTNHYKILAHETISQMNLHREFGGVYPTLSRREHERNLVPILKKCLTNASLLEEEDSELEADTISYCDELLERYPDLKEQFYNFFRLNKIYRVDYIAVTNGPGLPPALWVGVNFAKCVSKVLGNIPIYPINHMEGHIISATSTMTGNEININTLEYPSLSLLISGGHTELVVSTEPHKYEKIGETQDDAVGECYDKVARMLGLPYPGGPEISRLANLGRGARVSYNFKFPRPMLHSQDLNFSFSGLKTHILYLLRDLKEELTDQKRIEISTEFEEVVKDIFLKKIGAALEQTKSRSLVVGGGVACNDYLRDNFKILADELQINLHISEKSLSTDNALMIALTASTHINNKKEPTSEFVAVGSKNYNW